MNNQTVSYPSVYSLGWNHAHRRLYEVLLPRVEQLNADGYRTGAQLGNTDAVIFALIYRSEAETNHQCSDPGSADAGRLNKTAALFDKRRAVLMCVITIVSLKHHYAVYTQHFIMVH